MIKSIYTEIIKSKNGEFIPVLSDGKTIESKYDPNREADKLISSIDDKYLFFIILGVGSGLLIKKLIEGKNNIKIIAVENNQADYIFLSKLSHIKELLNNKQIVFTTIENIDISLINNYIPSYYGDYKIIKNNNWLNYNFDKIETINQKISKALGIISADYSVQCHFGKIWECNIINNLKILSNYKDLSFEKINIMKTAIIVAAGPTLDITISKLKKEINKFYIISTDTACRVLLSNNIIPNIIISIDGQEISHNHFFNNEKFKNTIFAIDLCSSYSVSNKLANTGNKILFFTTGHPLCNFINSQLKNEFINLFSGSGTVTITALDLAMKLGFNTIQIIGADFSYLNGKSYAKGTYFDSIYGYTTTRLYTLENQYDNLLYRTDTIKQSENKMTTLLLNAYKKSMEEFIEEKNYNIKYEDNTYYLKKRITKNTNLKLYNPEINYCEIYSQIKNIIPNFPVLLLPYIAWLRNNSKNNNQDIVELLKLAQTHIVRYN